MRNKLRLGLGLGLVLVLGSAAFAEGPLPADPAIATMQQEWQGLVGAQATMNSAIGHVQSSATTLVNELAARQRALETTQSQLNWWLDCVKQFTCIAWATGSQTNAPVTSPTNGEK